jgi:hypothetical protein
MATATRVASDNKGNHDRDEGGMQLTASRAIVVATTVVGEDEGGGNSDEGGR